MRRHAWTLLLHDAVLEQLRSLAGLRRMIVRRFRHQEGFLEAGAKRRKLEPLLEPRGPAALEPQALIRIKNTSKSMVGVRRFVLLQRGGSDDLPRARSEDPAPVPRRPRGGSGGRCAHDSYHPEKRCQVRAIVLSLSTTW